MSAPTPADQAAMIAAVRELRKLVEGLTAEITRLRVKLIETGRIKSNRGVTFEDIRKASRRW